MSAWGPGALRVLETKAEAWREKAVEGLGDGLLGKCLPDKPENLSLQEKQGKMVHQHKPSTGVAEAANRRGT